MDKDKVLDNMLRFYLDEEIPTQDRTAESVIIARITEASELLDRAIQPIREGETLDSEGVRTKILNTIVEVNVILYNANILMAGKLGKKKI